MTESLESQIADAQAAFDATVRHLEAYFASGYATQQQKHGALARRRTALKCLNKLKNLRDGVADPAQSE